jgi:hypothetical protein
MKKQHEKGSAPDNRLFEGAIGGRTIGGRTIRGRTICERTIRLMIAHDGWTLSWFLSLVETLAENETPFCNSYVIPARHRY